MEQLRGRGAGAQGHEAHHPTSYGGGQRAQRVERHRVGQAGHRLVGEAVEVLHVDPQLVGGAGQRLCDTRAELGLEHRQHPLPHPGSRVRRVGVVGVVPELDALDLAGGDGVGAGDVEQRPPVAVEAAPHARDRASTGATRQPEQHRLGLVVAGVAEQHPRGAEALADLVEDGVPGFAGRRLGPEPTALHRDPGADSLVDAEASHLLDDPPGLLVRPFLQAVVDGGPDDPQRLLAPLEHGGGHQRQGVRAARAGDDHGVTRLEIGQVTTHGPAYRRDGGVQGHARFISGRGRSRRRGRRARPSRGGSRSGPRRR